MRSGFFTKRDAQQMAKRAFKVPAGKRDLPVEEIQKMGPRAVKNMNPHAKHSNMQPTGNLKNPRVLWLGEAPGQADDEYGEHFVDTAGETLRDSIPDDVKGYFDYVCRTRPTGDRPPTRFELEAFRLDIVADIEKYKPEVIVGLGIVPYAWAYGLYGPLCKKIEPLRGTRMPLRVGKHTCWYYPVMHPKQLDSIMNSKRQEHQKTPGSEWAKYFERDIARVGTDLQEGLPEPPWIDPSDLLITSGVTVVPGNKSPVPYIEDFLDRVDSDTIAIDFETFGKRPYGKRAKRYCMAISDGGISVAFGIEHPDVSMSRADYHLLLILLRQLFDSGLKVVAHNMPFDLEWLAHWLGFETLGGSEWHCTYAAGYILDNRGGAHSLHHLCTREFGLPLKAATEGAQHRSDLGERKLDEALLYCGADAKWHHRLHTRLQKRVKNEGLRDAYRLQRERISAIVGAQLLGIPVNDEARDRVRRKLETGIKKIVADIEALPECGEYQDRFLARFNPGSPADVGKMLQTVLGRDEGLQKNGKYSTGEDVLAQLTDEPLAKMVMRYRNLNKTLSTYVLPLYLDNEKGTVVWPDGRLHTLFNQMFTTTGRLSSENPNQQNWPKRKDKWVREVIAAPPGCMLLSIDYGQIEARCIAMASKDRFFIKALWDEYDIHQHWAEEIARIHPASLSSRGGELKKLRTDVKNQMVFPAFYGASERYIARLLDVPQQKAHRLFETFWSEHEDVIPWREGLIEFYEGHGFVQALTGRRRQGPLSVNQIANSPIQGTASDIVIDGMSRMSEIALQDDKPWLHPILNIHDDLTFIVPNEKLDDAIEIAITELLGFQADWVNVPLAVEAELGNDWANMKEIGTFRSDEL